MEYLSRDEQAALNTLCLTDTSAAEVFEELDRIYKSGTFRRVQDHAKDFLGFVVAMTVLGYLARIKEVMIGIHVFGKSADYDPGQDSTVRVAAITLRQRLAEYYKDEGSSRPIRIVIPSGAYVPQITDRRPAVSVRVFENWNVDHAQDYLCVAVSDEIVHQLLVSRECLIAQRDVATKSERQVATYHLRGSLECEGDRTRMHVSLSNIHTAQILLGQTLEGGRDDVLKLCRQFAKAISDRVTQETRNGAPPRQLSWPSADLHV